MRYQLKKPRRKITLDLLPPLPPAEEIYSPDTIVMDLDFWYSRQEKARTALTRGERALIGAVLQRAIEDVTSSELVLKQAAEEWFAAPEDSSIAFSFSWICSELGIAADAIKADLPRISKALKKSKGSPLQPSQQCELARD